MEIRDDFHLLFFVYRDAYLEQLKIVWSFSMK